MTNAEFVECEQGKSYEEIVAALQYMVCSSLAPEVSIKGQVDGMNCYE